MSAAHPACSLLTDTEFVWLTVGPIPQVHARYPFPVSFCQKDSVQVRLQNRWDPLTFHVNHSRRWQLPWAEACVLRVSSRKAQ